MARGSRFSCEQLDWATDWYLREATLYPANACLVDYHHALALAGAVGSGRLSSSDGVRVASRTRGPETGALPRYFGHRRRGIQHYSWTSDQYSQYDSRVISANVRDATYTLDGILDNHTALQIEEHTTDTHGYTEMIFAARAVCRALRTVRLPPSHHPAPPFGCRRLLCRCRLRGP